MPSWIGPWEIAIVLVLALLIFGPRKLPDLGASLGKSIRGFKKGLKETEDEVKTAVAEVREVADKPDAEPPKAEAVQTAQAGSAEVTTPAAAAGAPTTTLAAAPAADALAVSVAAAEQITSAQTEKSG